MRTRWIPIALCLALSGGCADTSFTTGGDGSVNPADEDDDDFTKDVDCDDKDPDVHPGALERENCLDDNCDGKVDEGTPNFDADGDGFCPSTGDIGECEGNVSRNPGKAEDGGDGSGKPNGIDENCNGIVDDGLPYSDVDGDGFNIQEGDCNDNDPYINPGAIEVEGQHCKEPTDCAIGKCYDGYCRCQDNADCSSGDPCFENKDCKFGGESCKGGKCVSVYTCMAVPDGMPNEALKVCRDNTDNDCDKQIDEMPAACDDLAQLNQTDPYDFARAMELCDTDRTCGMESKCPGQLKCVDGKCTRIISASFDSGSDARARVIAVDFAQGGPFKPKTGQSFVVLSTGLASYDPQQVCPQSGTEFGNSTTDPDPSTTDKEANDYVHLALEILVPTNAQSFDFDFHFFSTEYPEWVGSAYNDTFWVQLSSKKFTGNISFDKNSTPIRINNSFFDICDPDPYNPLTSKMCSQPAMLLSGTGYDKDCPGSEYTATGGSTGWLHTTSPVTPGEILKLTFSIFDKGDGILDSAVLIDNFRWKLTPATKPQTGPD